MPNFFSALDDSDNEGKASAPVATKKKAPKKTVVEPSKVDKRPNKGNSDKGDRHTKGGRSSRPPPATASAPSTANPEPAAARK